MGLSSSEKEEHTQWGHQGFLPNPAGGYQEEERAPDVHRCIFTHPTHTTHTHKCTHIYIHTQIPHTHSPYTTHTYTYTTHHTHTTPYPLPQCMHTHTPQHTHISHTMHAHTHIYTFPSLYVPTLYKELCYGASISFLSLWQNTWDNQLKRRNIYFAHNFRDFNPCPLDPVVFSLRQHGISWPHCDQEEKDRNRKE
jgi:hypothetical protein